MGWNEQSAQSLFDELIAFRRERIQKGLSRGTTPIDVIRANLSWAEEHAVELGTFLT